MSSPMMGADVEVFVRDYATGDLDSAIKYIPGTKKNPQKTDHGYIQHDNVMAEFNITPHTRRDGFVVNTLQVIRDLQVALAEHHKEILIKPSAVFPADLLEHPEAQRIGCEPDFNVWALDVEYKIDALQLGNMRTCGGHIHIGWDHIGDVRPADQLAVVQACDLYLGLPSVLLDNDKTRRKYYGQAGHFRAKSYGIEYRVLSNFWIKTQEHMGWAARQTRAAYEASSILRDQISPDDMKAVVAAINTSDKEQAEKLCDKFSINAKVRE